MKIAMILDKKFPNDVRVENEAQALIEEGHEISLFCLNYNSDNKPYVYNGINVYPILFSQFIFNKFSPLAFSIPLYHYFLQSKIKDFINKVKPDAIHVHDMVAAENVFRVVKNNKIPIVLDLHEDRPAIMKDYSHVNSGVGKVFINLNKWEKKQQEFISKADKVVVVTEEARHNLLDSGDIKQAKIHVVPNSVDLDLFLNVPIDKSVTQKYEKNFVILYIGATGVRRGTDTLIYSAAILRKTIPNLKVVIVGSSRDDKYLRQITAKEKLENIIDFEGWQDFNQLPSYIKASDICVSPLKRNKHHDSTYANKLFQYMAFGKPVVASDSTAQANLVTKDKTGIVHLASSVSELAKKVLYLYNNPATAEKIGNNGKKVVLEKYQWNIVNKQLISIYKNFGK